MDLTHAPARTRPPARRRPRSVALAGVLVGLLGGLLGTTGVVAAEPAAASGRQCPVTGGMPSVGPVTSTDFVDRNVNVLVGGDFLATGAAAETEGLLVVKGDATFDKSATGSYNLGSVGAGSGIVPEEGGAMLVVGGDLTVGPRTTLRVGSLFADRGSVRVGGTVDGLARIEALQDGGTAPGVRLEQGMGTEAVAPWAGAVAATTALADGLAGLVAENGEDGDVVRLGPTYSRITLTAQSAPAVPGRPLVFTLPVDATSSGRSVEIHLDGLPPDVPLLINVRGAVDLTLTVTAVFRDGVRVDTFDTLGDTASALLWNFVDQPTVTVSGGQLVGSILAPRADLVLHASTNGRVHTGGDLTVDGEGIEQHAYPWIGGWGLECLDSSTPAVVPTPEATPSPDVTPTPAPEPDVTPTTAPTPVPGATPAPEGTPDVPPSAGSSSGATPDGGDRAAPGELARAGSTAGVPALAAGGLLVAGAVVLLAVRRARNG